MSNGRAGRQYRFLLPGPELAPRQIRNDCSKCSRPRSVIGHDVCRRQRQPAARRSHGTFYRQVARDVAGARHDARFALDSSGEALTGAGTGIFLIKASLRELSQLHGAPIAGDAVLEKAARAVISDGRCEVLVVSLGADGALLATADRVPAVRGGAG